MIRHQPFGIGHPYRIELDQRMPAIPIAGEPFELRVMTDASARRVRLEMLSNGHATLLDALPVELHSVTSHGQGHLASAAAAGGKRNRRFWVARPGPLSFGSEVRYRFVADRHAGGQKTRWFRVAPARWQPSGGTLEFEPSASPRLVPNSVEWLVGSQGPLRARLALRLQPDEHVVGFGERFDFLDQRGQTLDAIVYEQYKAQGSRTYLPMPFAIVAGGQGWGFHVATSRRTWFDVGVGDAGQLRIEAALDPGEAILKIELFNGAPHEVLSAFLERTGLPKLPPDWVFRPWMSGNEWNTQARVLAEVERSRVESIPVGVVVIEAWSDESTFVAFRDAEYTVHRDGAPHRLADFRFPPDGAWPDPRHMVDQLHELGVKVLLWQIPLLKARPRPGTQARFDQDTMVSRGYAVRQAGGQPYRTRGWWFHRALMPDFTSAGARDWWLAKRRYLVDEVGVDGFKTDGGEHAWGDDLRYADGSRGEAGNNRYPVAYAAAYHALIASSGREGITFSRAGFTGCAAYPCHWAGDEDSTWEAFRASITAGLTAGASGIFFWGWDLAGFSGEIPSVELYLRAAAMACFCPIMQYHSEYNFHRKPSRDRTPWNIAERTGDARILPVFRRFATLRDALVPYLSAQAARSVETGKPLMRALFFDVLDDEEIWRWPHEYFLGDGLLVAPVTQPDVRSWRLYLPAGRWVDAWSGEEHEGGAVIERAVPLDEIPVYARADRSLELRTVFVKAASAGNAGGG